MVTSHVVVPCCTSERKSYLPKLLRFLKYSIATCAPLHFQITVHSKTYNILFKFDLLIFSWLGCFYFVNKTRRRDSSRDILWKVIDNHLIIQFDLLYSCFYANVDLFYICSTFIKPIMPRKIVATTTTTSFAKMQQNTTAYTMCTLEKK